MGTMFNCYNYELIFIKLEKFIFNTFTYRNTMVKAIWNLKYEML